MSDFFCQLPFVAMDTDGKSAKPCCVWTGPYMPLKGYETNPKLIEIKNKLFKGESPNECNTCVKQEMLTKKSFRILANEFHPTISEEILAHDASYSSIRNVQIVGSNVCNLQCLPCLDSSFKRSKELHDIGFINQMPKLRTISDIDLIANLDDIEQLTLCSGEPFYDKNSLRLLDLLVQNGKSRRLRLDINTNLTCITQDRMNYLVENFNRVLIKGSIDGIHEAHEYLRYPSSWQEIQESVEILMSMPDVEFVVTTALSNLSLLGYTDLMKHLLDMGVKYFFISNVASPAVLSSSNLPTQLKHEICQQLIDLKETTTLSDRAINSLDTCINICNNTHPWTPDPLINFLQKHDNFRKTNWRKIWPKLAEYC
jgi:sulfatase maturation enzyme AslB (radical SAM superfamily)